MALGHWLKDYLGPKASGEGGGSVEVSKIKIVTANGGWSSNQFNGGFQISGSQILDLIGDKTIIGIEMVGAGTSEPTKTYPIDGVATFASSTPSYKVFNPVLATREEIASVDGGQVGGTSTSSITDGGGAVDVYAICI